MTKKLRTSKLPADQKAELFAEELAELHGIVSEGDYDARSKVFVSEELQQFLLSQNVGQVARAFRGSDKTTNVHDTAVSLMEQLVRFEDKQYRHYNDDEITTNFWNMVEGKNLSKPELSTSEFRHQQAVKLERREAKAAAKAEKRGAEGGFADRITAQRDASEHRGASL